MSFSNNKRLIEKISNNAINNDFIVFYDPKVKDSAEYLSQRGIRICPLKNGLKLVFILLPIIMSGKLIFCDNYFPFLGGIYHPKNMKIIQLWHANGAIKKFGWEDPSTLNRSYFDKKRFQLVYNQFDNYIVASKTMGKIFSNSYHVNINKMKLFGYPRSDHLLNSEWIIKSRQHLYHKAPELKKHRVILYAPTYRKGITFNPPSHLIQALSSDPNAIVIIKLHPLLKKEEYKINNSINSNRAFVYNQFLTTELLAITDTLITDYSSIAFDFTLLPNARSLLFYMFDLDKYNDKPGIQDNIFAHLPSKPIFNTKNLAKAIKLNRKMDFQKFNQYWNTYNDGHASDRFIRYFVNN